MTYTRSYSGMLRYNRFEDRFEYLKLSGVIGYSTFGGHRYLNQILYESKEWKSVRREVIFRDSGNDLGMNDYPIYGRAYIHHINAITENDILERTEKVFDLENLVCVSFETHNAIHYGNSESLKKEYVERFPGDTSLW